MKQVVQNYRTGDLTVDEVPPPVLRPGGVLVRTAYSLISAGTERTVVSTAQSSLLGKARSRPDLVRQVLDSVKNEGIRATYEKVSSRLNQIKPLGYSASGTVIAIGEGVRGIAVGDRVACAGAGYASHAELLFVPQNLCSRLPEGTSLEAACYTTVGAIALHGIRQSEARLGETVAVIGLGLVGQLAVQMLKAAACRVLGVDIDPAAIELAGKSGADRTSNPSDAADACHALTEGRGADCVLVTAATTSNDPIELAGRLARDRGRVVVVGLVGMDIPRHIYYEKELELRLSRSYGPGRYDPEYEERGNDYPIGYVRWTEKRNMDAFLSLVAEGKVAIELLTTHRFPVERATDAYDLITKRGGERYCGVVLQYSGAGHQTVEPERAVRARSASSDKVGIGFIGAGTFARGVLLPILRRETKVQLTGVGTATGISAKNTAEQFGFSYATTDFEQILDDEQTRAVFIATRHDSHAGIAARALQRGKSVFVEKPLATTEDGLRKVVEALSESHGVLMVGFNRRFAPIARQIKARLDDRSGLMTVVYRVNAGQLPRDHWALDPIEGGGRVIGEVCHFVDFIQYLTGALPARVSAEAVSQNRAGFVDDSVAITMTMTDGSIASIIYTASGDKAVGKERVEVFCDRSVALIDDFKTGLFISGGKQTRLGRGARDKGHAAEVSAFIAAVREGSDSPIGIQSLIATTLACFAAFKSARSWTTVTLDVDRIGLS
jgi:predicted dehydrogenase/threonine dehydrogenase-like Zn-dependent dehydrogenase